MTIPLTAEQQAVQDRLALLSAAVLSKQGRNDMIWSGEHPHSYWTYQAVLIGMFMDVTNPLPETNRKGLRVIAMRYWDNAAKFGKLLDC